MNNQTEEWKQLYDSPVHLISSQKRFKVLGRTVYINYGNDLEKNFRVYPDKFLIPARVDKTVWENYYVRVKYINPDGRKVSRRINIDTAFRDHFPELANKTENMSSNVDPMHEFATFCREARQAKGMTQEELSIKAFGNNRRVYITEIESGTRSGITLLMMHKILTALDAKIKYYQ